MSERERILNSFARIISQIERAETRVSADPSRTKVEFERLIKGVEDEREATRSIINRAEAD